MVKIDEWRRDASGNVAVIFSLVLLPLALMVGSVTDYTRATLVDARLRKAIDAAALAVAKTAAAASTTQLNQKATDTVSALMKDADATLGPVTATYTATGRRKVTVTGSATVPTVFMKIAGVAAIPVSAEATVTWGATRLRVALALDNTASMADDGKLAALKTAAQKLLSQLREGAPNTGDAYVSIIPFNKDVNVGASNYTAPWIRWDTWSNQTCIFIIICTNNPNRSSWNGCVTDRDQSYDTNAISPSGSQVTLFPAEQYSACPTQLMGLSSDWSALSAKIDAMTASGTTNQTIGLQWAFQSLETNSPLPNPALDPSYQYKRVIVLLTDGLNTQNRWSSNQASIDARTLAACTNIKSAGYTLYVVQVNTGGDPTSTMLQQCASRASAFFVLTSATQIVTTFDQIATELSQTYISR